jgi:hypothetical protein
MNSFFRVAIAGLTAVAFPEARTMLEPFFGRGSGSTLFRLEATVPITGQADSLPEGTQGLIQSELEFPMDMFIAGLRWRTEIGAENSRTTGLSFGVWMNVADPGSPMLDTDWLGFKMSSGGSTPLYKFSYTESRAEARWFGAEGSVDFGSFRPFRTPVRYGLSVRAEHFAYRLFGIKGWQRMPGSPSVPVDALRKTLVLTYDLTRLVPLLSADMRLVEGRKATWKAVFSGGPAFAWDYDDHVLRFKESDAYAFGFEAGLLTEIEFRISQRASLVPTVRLAYLRTKGTMDQRFYADDPSTMDLDETGMTHPNVENRIISFAGSASLGYRYRF